MSSAFDDLLDLGDSSGNGNVNQSNNPFDSYGSNQSGGDLLDLGFDAPISTQNGSSAKVNYEANTNPLYELSNSQNTMENQSNDLLFDFSAEPQKESKMESSGNPLYDFLQGETTNGHGDDVLTNGANNDVDLLGLSGEATATGAVTSDDSGITFDSNNLNESNPEPELESEPELEQEAVQDADLEPEREPEQEPEPEFEAEDEPEFEPEAEIQERSRSNSEGSEPEEQKQNAVTVEQNGATFPEAPSKSPEEIPDQEVGPAEADQGQLNTVKDESLNAEVGEEGKAIGQETPDANVDGAPTQIEEPITAHTEQGVEAGNAPVTEIKESNDDAANEMTEPKEVEQETIPTIDSQPESLVENKEDNEEQENLGPEPSEQKEAVQPDQTQLVSEEPVQTPEAQTAEDELTAPEPVNEEAGPVEIDEPVQLQNDVEQPNAETSETAPAAFEEEQVEQEVPEAVEVQQAAPALVDDEQAEPKPAEVEEVVPESVEVEQAVPEQAEVVEARPEPVDADESESKPTEVEAVSENTKDEKFESETKPNEVEEAVSETADVEMAESEPAETVQAADVEQPTPVAEEEQAIVQPDLAETVAAEQALPGSGMEPQIETQQPVSEPAVEEDNNGNVAANVPDNQPEEQPLETAVETTEPVQDEDQKVPQSPVQDARGEADDRTPAENGVAKQVNGTNEVKQQNGVTEEEAVRDPSIFRETREREEIHFAEMNNFREKFESGKVDEREVKKTSVKDEYDQGGEYENEPVENPDVVKESKRTAENLPEVGSAKNLRDKFKSIQEEKSRTVTSQKRNSPPREERVEYESTPTERLVIEAGQSEQGEFESTPQTREDVTRSGDRIEESQPEKGSTKNIMNRFKEIQTDAGAQKPRQQRELTPDSSGKSEYTSEPRGQRIEYEESKTESGVFENQPHCDEEDVVRSEDRAQEVLPESGMAKNLLSKFKQMESEAGNKAPPSPKREVRAITPDRSGKVEYTSEPRGAKIEYEEQKEDSGVYESKPVVPLEVVRSEDMVDDVKPEAGSAKKTMERFKEMQKQSSSPVSSSPRKEITPPREASPGKTVAGVVESTPTEKRDDVVRCGDRVQEELPEVGAAKNILNKFREIQSSGGTSPVSPSKKHKEFTPPPDSGVYENTPTERIVLEEQKSFEGVLENTPTKSQADVARDHEHSVEKELPETGTAKNLVSKFRQLESTSAKSSTSASPKRFKEFTPPRDRGPLSPKSPAGQPSDGVNLSDLPGQYQQQEKPGIFENEPEQRPDVYREADTDYDAGLPAANTTLSMLEKFRSIQDQAKVDQTTPTPVSRKDDTPSSPDPEEKGMFKVVQTEKCDACEKTVYAMEKLEMNGHIYHKNCFKCSHCSARLTPKTFSMNEGVIYCVNHFKQLFARKGNYDEGFGRQQYKKKWGDSKTNEVATV